MTPNEFQPAQTLDEANERLRRLTADQTKLKAELEDALDEVRWLTPITTAAEAEQFIRDLEAEECVDAEEFLARLKAEMEGMDGQH